MANGLLGKGIISSANTNQTIYTVPANTYATVNISFCNSNVSSIKVRLAVTNSTTPQASDYIDYDTNIIGNGVMEKTGMVLSAGEKVIISASSTGISVRVHGFEEAV